MEFSLGDVRGFVAEHCWLLGSLVLLTLLVWYGTAPFLLFKKLGVPGPSPWPFVGNVPTMIRMGAGEQAYKFHYELSKKYGRVCGYYLGRMPIFQITDLDLIKQVFVKEFTKFYNRPASLRRNTSPPLDKGLVFTHDEIWKRIRTTVTPTFSASKLKQVIPLMHESCEILRQRLGEMADSGESADISSVYERFTMEVILSSSFGIKANTQMDQNNEFNIRAKTMFARKRLPTLAVIFPFLAPVLSRLRYHGNTSLAQAFDFFVSLGKRVIDLRRKTADSTRRDLLELMIQAELVEADGTTKVSKLSDDEIVAQSITFMMAGTMTTAAALVFATYFLALNPDKQEKLLDEIDSAVPDGEMPGYDTLQNLQYLDMFLSEAMRIFPPVVSVPRQCNEACTINGIHFPKDATVLVPPFALHRDPEYWPDPDKFEPERFSPEEKKKRNPFCYMPFGAGPRNCIGMRFALLEAKMALATLLKVIKFERAADTQVPLELFARVSMTPTDGLRVKVVRRK